MAADIPQFPLNDERVKTIAILGYTGVGKTSVITAAYSENIIYGKDAFTQRFFQRIEDEIRLYGQIPLTMGEASTLSFIESRSRSEFTVQDFSGEHIKLERKDERSYQDLIVRADDAHALVCMVSADSFYSQDRIHEEVDAIQTFVNKLRGLGTRIPVAVVLTKCDTVPRFYIDFPILKSICRFLSSLPFLSLSPQDGLDVTRRRFPKIFSGLDFRGKGPRCVFMGLSLPRLRKLKARQWPRGLRWLGKLMRKVMINPRFLFKKNFRLQAPFDFCFQAFQLSVLRNLLVSGHKDRDYCQKVLEQFEQGVITSQPFGDVFYFQDYFERILEDTTSLIAEMEEEIASLGETAGRLLANERELALNLQLWLDQATEKIHKFNKPWSDGARKRLEELRRETLEKVRDKLREKITATLEETGETTFYRLIEILKIRREIAGMPIWKQEEIALPEVESFQKRLMEHYIVLTLSRAELPMAQFMEDRNKYLEALTIASPPEMEMLDDLAKAAVTLQGELNQYQPGAGEWGKRILVSLEIFQQKWLHLARHFNLTQDCELRKKIENKLLTTLEQEAGHFKSLAEILNWAAEAKQLLYGERSQEKLQKVIQAAREKSQSLLRKTMEEFSVRAQKCWDNHRQFPSRLKTWFDECSHRHEYLNMISGREGIEKLQELQKEILVKAKNFLDEMVEKKLQSSLEKLDRHTEDRAEFIAIVEVLQVYREIENQDLLSQHGLAMPSISELEKASFYHLILITLLRNGLTYALYEEDRARLACVSKNSESSLGSLDALVQSFESLYKGGKEMPSLPTGEWEARILAPMRSFHQSWLELAGQFELPEQAAVRREAEQIAVRSLKDHAASLKLRRLRDWVAMLYPLLQISENRQQLDNLQRNTEDEIRTRLKSDLEEFMERCQALAIAAQNIGEKASEADDAWQKFSGSVAALAYNVEKFPHTELTLDDGIREILEHKGPDRFKKSLEDWTQAIKQNRMLSTGRCQAIDSVLSKAREIFRRPEAFSGIGDQVASRLAYLKRKRAWMTRIAVLLVIATAMLAGVFAFRQYLNEQAHQVSTFAGRNFDRHLEIAKRWENLTKYPRWLLPNAREIDKQATIHRQLAQLTEIAKNMHQKQTTEKQLVTCQTKLQQLLATEPPEQVRVKVYEVLLEVRATQILRNLARDPADRLSPKLLGDLEEIERMVKRRVPVFYSPLLEELRRVYRKQNAEKGRK